MTTGPFSVGYKSLASTVAILDKVSPMETPVARIGEGSSTSSLSTSLSPSTAPPMQPSPQKIYSGVVVAIVLAVLVGVVGIIILFLEECLRMAALGAIHTCINHN
ncbi:hypothetical protein PHLCEN_2v13097 [Hermanssonia centrifuga]|uniref:Uncharacterized protein n=1 Tax=Hermanssonia centrifuga TaxID=98765 RepID=A0A2R6NF46_9APHY|nr:hypothetical protein PHLCEN_2v13097 [Hermanssonia centrifuga]